MVLELSPEAPFLPATERTMDFAKTFAPATEKTGFATVARTDLDSLHTLSRARVSKIDENFWKPQGAEAFHGNGSHGKISVPRF